MKRAHGSTARNELLDAARLDKGWSIEELAETAETHPITVQRWLCGATFPTPLKLRKLCVALGKTAAELGFEKNPPVVVHHTAEDTTISKDIQQPIAPTVAEDIQQPIAPTVAEDIEQSVAPTKSGDIGQSIDSTVSEDIKEPELPIGKEYESFRESDLALRLFLCVRNYPRTSKARYHELQALMALELRDNKMEISELSRRDSLKFIAAMPIELCGLSMLKPVFKESHNEILLQCGAGITACWGLRKTQDLNFAAQTVAKYIPTLKEMAIIGAPQQRKEAAELLFQSFLLLAMHSIVTIVGAHNAVAYAQQAKKYSKQAENPLLQIIALRTQSAAYEYAGDWKSALDTGLRAKGLLETTKSMPIPLLVDSYVYGGLANYQAYFGLKDDAEASLKQAYTAFFAQTQGEPAPIWIDHTIGALLRNDGKMHMHLGHYKEAINSFGQMDSDYAHDTSTPFGTRIEVMINQIIAEMTRTDQTRNMGWCIESWKRSLNDARALGSRSKENKVVQVHTTMLAVWPRETDVTELRDLLM